MSKRTNERKMCRRTDQDLGIMLKLLQLGRKPLNIPGDTNWPARRRKARSSSKAREYCRKGLRQCGEVQKAYHDNGY